LLKPCTIFVVDRFDRERQYPVNLAAPMCHSLSPRPGPHHNSKEHYD
jgi:hypothetical protein